MRHSDYIDDSLEQCSFTGGSESSLAMSEFLMVDASSTWVSKTHHVEINIHLHFSSKSNTHRHDMVDIYFRKLITQVGLFNRNTLLFLYQLASYPDLHVCLYQLVLQCIEIWVSLVLDMNNCYYTCWKARAGLNVLKRELQRSVMRIACKYTMNTHAHHTKRIPTQDNVHVHGYQTYNHGQSWLSLVSSKSHKIICVC